ncbi:MAG TPA: hypothetical protein VKF62_11610 [Planctomycetota bacterium]|nr:hypothetical protein [Planctomycetota bacterium]
MIANTLLLHVLLAAPLQKAAPEKTDYAGLRRDLEVMRRILEREAFGRTGDYAALENLLSGVGSAGRGEGLYIPGDGALFLFRVGLPLVDDSPAATDGKGDAEPTLWDRVQAEVEGKSIPEKGAKKAFDPERVEALKSKILETLAKYGGNVRQVSDEEHLTVVVRSHGGPAVYSYSQKDPDDASVFYKLGQYEGLKGDLAAAGDLLGRFSGGGPGSVLVVRITRADAEAFAAGSIDMGALRKRAKIVQY